VAAAFVMELFLALSSSTFSSSVLSSSVLPSSTFSSSVLSSSTFSSSVLLSSVLSSSVLSSSEFSSSEFSFSVLFSEFPSFDSELISVSGRATLVSSFSVFSSDSSELSPAKIGCFTGSVEASVFSVLSVFGGVAFKFYPSASCRLSCCDIFFNVLVC
jgi:hypothetical protein